MYKKVIAAVDLSDSSQHVLDTALKLVDSGNGKLILTHVVEPIPAVWAMEAYSLEPVELQQRIEKIAREYLQEMGDKSGIDESNSAILHGAVASELQEYSQEVGADAIVIGGHGHSGWKRMLGSNASKLLHGARCDVLTVHVGD